MPDHLMVGPHRTPFDIPGSKKRFKVHDVGEGVDRFERRDGLFHLRNGWNIRAKYPAGLQVLGGDGCRMPGLWKVKNQPIGTDFGDHILNLADSQFQVVRKAPKESGNGLFCLTSVVFPAINAHNPARGADGPYQSHGECTRPGACLQNHRTGRHVPVHEDGANVFRVDDLSSPLHLQDVIGEFGRKRDELAAGGGFKHRPMERTNQFDMGDRPLVGRKLPTRVKLDEVSSRLRINDQSHIAIFECRGIHLVSENRNGTGEGDEHHGENNDPDDDFSHVVVVHKVDILRDRLKSMNLVGFGIERLMRGFRTGDQKIVALGVGAVMLAMLRKPPKRELLASYRLDRGDEYVIKLRGPGPKRSDSDESNLVDLDDGATLATAAATEEENNED